MSNVSDYIRTQMLRRSAIPMRRFLHLIEDQHGGQCCIWRELKDDEVTFDIMRTDIHCMYVLPLGGPFDPDHCQNADAVEYLPQL